MGLRTPTRARTRVLQALLSATVIIALTPCTASPPPQPTPALPPAGGTPDYQLGGAYAPPPGVSIVARDRSDAPAPGLYSICYLNAFQTQPGDLADWPDDLLLHDASDSGEIVFDPAWPDEALLDTATAEKREAIAARVAPWIRGCADDGFDAVEFDNLDSYTRSGGALTLASNAELAASLVAVAHSAGLAAAQKNGAEDASFLRDHASFDFAVTEECARYYECDLYADMYGAHVIDIEYSDDLDRPFAEICADASSPASVVLRDRDLTTPNEPGYVFELCAD